jgi:hypothetical protein
MMWKILTLLALAAGPAAAAPEPTAPQPWPVARFQPLAGDWRSGTIEAAGLTARIARKACGDGRPVSEACGAGDSYVTARIEAPGAAAVTVEGAAGLRWFVGIGRLGAGAARPSLILVTDDGGSGGCVTLDLATPEGRAWRAFRLADGQGRRNLAFCSVDPAQLAWPADLTGHGRAEMLLPDTRFACRFASCAGSRLPPRLLAIAGDQAVDVSADPALAPLFRADLSRNRDACEQAAEEAEAPCAAFAADAARLGRIDEAWNVIAAQVRRGCRVRMAEADCYEINRFHADFPARLRETLRRGGYLRADRAAAGAAAGHPDDAPDLAAAS